MPSDFPFLDSLAEEIHKIHFETEEQAKSLIANDLTELRQKKDQAFILAKERIAKHTDAITGMKEGLDKAINKLSNSGVVVRPIDGQKKPGE